MKMKNEKNDKILNYYVNKINYVIEKENYNFKIKVVKDYISILLHYIDSLDELKFYLRKINDNECIIQYAIFDLFEEIFKLC